MSIDISWFWLSLWQYQFWYNVYNNILFDYENLRSENRDALLEMTHPLDINIFWSHQNERHIFTVHTNTVSFDIVFWVQYYSWLPCTGWWVMRELFYQLIMFPIRPVTKDQLIVFSTLALADSWPGIAGATHRRRCYYLTHRQVL